MAATKRVRNEWQYYRFLANYARKGIINRSQNNREDRFLESQANTDRWRFIPDASQCAVALRPVEI